MATSQRNRDLSLVKVSLSRSNVVDSISHYVTAVQQQQYNPARHIAETPQLFSYSLRALAKQILAGITNCCYNLGKLSMSCAWKNTNTFFEVSFLTLKTRNKRSYGTVQNS